MSKSMETVYSKADLANWLLSAIERHSTNERIQSTLVSEFGLSDDEAIVAAERARDGVLRAANVPKTRLSIGIGIRK